MFLSKKLTVPVLIVACTFMLVSAVFASRDAWATTNEFPPRPKTAINDYAGVIPANVKQAMESLAWEIQQKTETAVVVATFKSIGDYDPAQYANELYEAWGIGKKGVDKGVLFLLALQERRVRIETGYGVEGILPDGLVGSILDQYMVPLLKQGDYAKGLFNGMLAVGQVIAKDAGVKIGEGYRPAQVRGRQVQRRGSGLFSLIFLLFIFLSLFTRTGRSMLPILLLMGLSGGRGSSFGGGGGFSGGFGGFGGGLSGGGGAGRGF